MSRLWDSQIVTPRSRDPEMIISRSRHPILRWWDDYLEILTTSPEIPTSYLEILIWLSRHLTSYLEISTSYLEIPTSYLEILISKSWDKKNVGCPNSATVHLGLLNFLVIDKCWFSFFLSYFQWTDTLPRDERIPLGGLPRHLHVAFVSCVYIQQCSSHNCCIYSLIRYTATTTGSGTDLPQTAYTYCVFDWFLLFMHLYVV